MEVAGLTRLCLARDSLPAKLGAKRSRASPAKTHRMKNIILLSTLILVALTAEAQPKKDSATVHFSAYLETYYGYDFANPADHQRPDFLFSFNRHNEVNINFAFLQAAYEDERVRGKLALMTGTYANANLAAEPGVLKNIYEAHAGVKLSRHQNLWLEAGVFASHIGFESAIGAHTWNMTRSILAENSPYYLSGVKITYESKRWLFSGLVLNGWQRIQRAPGNQSPALGHQVTFKPRENLTLNSSSFVGSDSPDSTRKMRYFHNFYLQWQARERLGFIFGFDIGAQQALPGSSRHHLWYTPILIARYTLSEKWSLAARAEYYADKNEVIVTTAATGGFQTTGYSLNADWQVHQRVLWRWEARTFQSQENAIFANRQGEPSSSNTFLGSSLSFTF